MELLSKSDIQGFALETLRRAVPVAMNYYGKGNPLFKFDYDLVTTAEMNIDQKIRDEIHNSFPHAQIFGERKNTSEYHHGEAGLMWVYDALDGVANFQAGIPMWGISIALVENFWPIFGAYHMPASGDLFWGFADEKAFWNGIEMQYVETEPTNNESLLFTYSRFHDHFRTTFPGKIRNLGCSGAHICYVAGGRADGAVLRNISYRELIGLVIVLKSAGGLLEYVDGRPFQINDYLDGTRVKEFLLAVKLSEHEHLKDYLMRK